MGRFWTVMSVVWLTLSHPEALPWWVISSGHRQSKIHVKMGQFWLVYCRRERIIKEDRQIGPVIAISHPEALPWWVVSSGIRQSKIINGPVLAGLGGKELVLYMYIQVPVLYIKLNDSNILTTKSKGLFKK